MYYKYLINNIRKSVVISQGHPHDNIKRCDPLYATTTMSNITMDANPAYETDTTIKMGTNPANTATTTH